MGLVGMLFLRCRWIWRPRVGLSTQIIVFSRKSIGRGGSMLARIKVLNFVRFSAHYFAKKTGFSAVESRSVLFPVCLRRLVSLLSEFFFFDLVWGSQNRRVVWVAVMSNVGVDCAPGFHSGPNSFFAFSAAVQRRTK